MGNKEACGVRGNTFFLIVRTSCILPKTIRSSLCVGVGVSEYTHI